VIAVLIAACCLYDIDASATPPGSSASVLNIRRAGTRIRPSVPNFPCQRALSARPGRGPSVGSASHRMDGLRADPRSTLRPRPRACRLQSPSVFVLVPTRALWARASRALPDEWMTISHPHPAGVRRCGALSMRRKACVRPEKEATRSHALPERGYGRHYTHPYPHLQACVRFMLSGDTINHRTLEIDKLLPWWAGAGGALRGPRCTALRGLRDAAGQGGLSA